MAGKVGNKPLEKNNITNPKKLNCLCCNKVYDSSEFYDSDSEIYRSIGKIPYCKDCIENMYQDYLQKYKTFGYKEIKRRSIERLCMTFNLYYKDSIFDSAIKAFNEGSNATLVALYMKFVKLYQWRDKNYDNTIKDRYDVDEKSNPMPSFYKRDMKGREETIERATNFFGTGFSDDDYIFLQDQYDDWTTRHECQTKSQEEMFKQICFTQLELLKATRSGEDTKDLNATFLKQLEAAKLQPKQNSSETTSDSQTFGTLINKWENERPLPEIDEELRDVDKIGYYNEAIVRGHTCKMLGINNSYSKLYDKFMKEYSVNKPEYDDEDDSDVIFDAIFGGDLKDE